MLFNVLHMCLQNSWHCSSLSFTTVLENFSESKAFRWVSDQCVWDSLCYFSMLTLQYVDQWEKTPEILNYKFICNTKTAVLGKVIVK